MTLTDKPKILEDKIKANQAQYDLSREAAKISALLSKDLLEMYEYLTGEDLGHKPSICEKGKLEYSPLIMVLTNNTKNKTNTNRVDSKKKTHKYLIYNPQDSFANFNDIDEFKELSLDSMYKRLNDFKKIFNRLKAVNPEKDTNKVLKENVLDGVGDLFNELYYVYKDKQNEEKDSLNAKNKKKRNKHKKKVDYKILRPTDDYQYKSEQEKQQQQTSNKLD